MLTIVYTLICICSLFCAFLTNRLPALSAAVTTGAGQGFTLCLTIAGAICLWSGIFRAVEALQLSDKLSKLFSPLLKRIYPAAFCDKACAGAITGNFVSNLLGLGNAATPMGIEAVRRMAQMAQSAVASDEICRLIVMNTASVSLLPTSVASIRAGLGATHVFDILPAVWTSSLLSVTCGLAAAFLFSRWWKR